MGLRAAVKKGFEDSVLDLDADAICLQETKLQEGRSILIFRLPAVLELCREEGILGNCDFYALRAAARASRFGSA